MNDHFPDIVPARPRPPRYFIQLQAANGAAQIRAMPGFLVKGFVDDVQQEIDFSMRMLYKHEEFPMPPKQIDKLLNHTDQCIPNRKGYYSRETN
jgi:hypothetical protein